MNHRSMRSSPKTHAAAKAASAMDLDQFHPLKKKRQDKVRLFIRTHEELKTQILEQAARENLNVSDVCVIAIIEYLKRKRPSSAA